MWTRLSTYLDRVDKDEKETNLDERNKSGRLHRRQDSIWQTLLSRSLYYLTKHENSYLVTRRVVAF